MDDLDRCSKFPLPPLMTRFEVGSSRRTPQPASGVTTFVGIGGTPVVVIGGAGVFGSIGGNSVVVVVVVRFLASRGTEQHLATGSGHAGTPALLLRPDLK